jgi:hypothetical protein
MQENFVPITQYKTQMNMDNIKAKPCLKHKQQGKFMISECDIYKTAADTQDYGWV